jgi:hypothetical protein
MLDTCVAYSLILKLEMTCSFRTSDIFQRDTHHVISQKIELFITTAVSTSNPSPLYSSVLFMRYLYIKSPLERKRWALKCGIKRDRNFKLATQLNRGINLCSTFTDICFFFKYFGLLKCSLRFSKRRF